MATQKEQQLADQIIQTLLDAGYTYENMLPVIRLAREKFDHLVRNGDIETILESISRYYHISSEDIFKQTRKTEIREPRQIAMWYMSKRLGRGPSYVGNYFNMSHATVIHANNVIETEMEMNPAFKTKIDNIISGC